MEKEKDLKTLYCHVNAIMPMKLECFDMIAPHIELIDVNKNDLLWKQDKKCEYVYCVREGMFRCFFLEDGEDYTRWFSTMGDFFTSSYAMSTGQPAKSSVEALLKGSVWRMPVKKAIEILDNSDDWSKWLMKMLLNGFGSWESRDRALISKDAYSRFSKFYSFIPYELLAQIPLQYIASYLKMTPQTLCSCRRRYFKEKKNN